MQERTTLPEVGPAGPPPGAIPNKHQVLSRRNILATLGVTTAGGALAMVSYRDEAQAAVLEDGDRDHVGEDHQACLVHGHRPAHV